MRLYRLVLARDNLPESLYTICELLATQLPRQNVHDRRHALLDAPDNIIFPEERDRAGRWMTAFTSAGKRQK